MNKKEKAEKIKQYEDFVNNTLKIDLKEIEDILMVRSAEAKKWQELKTCIKMLEYHKKYVTEDDLTIYNPLLYLGPLLNKEIYSKTIVDNVDTIHVKIGCNCVLEMSLEEANKYADIRLNIIEKQINHFKKVAVTVKVNIKLVLLAINELDPVQNSNYEADVHTDTVI